MVQRAADPPRRPERRGTGVPPELGGGAPRPRQRDRPVQEDAAADRLGEPAAPGRHRRGPLRQGELRLRPPAGHGLGAAPVRGVAGHGRGPVYVQVGEARRSSVIIVIVHVAVA